MKFAELEQRKGAVMKPVARLLKSFVAPLVVVVGMAAPALAQKYVVTDLGNLTGFTFPSPSGINSLGQVAGTTNNATFSVSHPFRTAPNRPINPLTDDLGLLPGATSGSASGINSLGQVSGSADFPIVGSPGFFTGHAFRADPGNPNLVDLGLRTISGFLGFNSSNANGINNSGQVAGSATSKTNAFICLGQVESQALRTLPNGPVSTADDLGTVQTGDCGFSFGFAINASGQMVGYSNLGGFFGPPFHAFLATPGMKMQDLGTLGAFSLTSMALSINDAGKVVGQSGVGGGVNHAFLVNPGSAMQDLGTLGGSNSSANAINNVDQIVGNSLLTGNAAIHAFIYQSGTMSDLNSLIPTNTGWVIENATAINDVGQIVGTGTLNGVFSAFRLDAPGTAVAILTSLLSDPSLGLTNGQVSSFTDKLGNALASIQQGLFQQAINQLHAFTNAVQVALKNGKISAPTAATLTAAANAVIAAIS